MTTIHSEHVCNCQMTTRNKERVGGRKGGGKEEGKGVPFSTLSVLLEPNSQVPTKHCNRTGDITSLCPYAHLLWIPQTTHSWHPNYHCCIPLCPTQVNSHCSTSDHTYQTARWTTGRLHSHSLPQTQCLSLLSSIATDHQLWTPFPLPTSPVDPRHAILIAAQLLTLAGIPCEHTS